MRSQGASRPRQPSRRLKAPQEPDSPDVVSKRLKTKEPQDPDSPDAVSRRLKNQTTQMWSQKALKNRDPRTTTLIVQEVSECSLSVQHITVSFVFTETFCTLACCTPPRASLPPLPIPLSYASQRRG